MGHVGVHFETSVQSPFVEISGGAYWAEEALKEISLYFANVVTYHAR